MDPSSQTNSLTHSPSLPQLDVFKVSFEQLRFVVHYFPVLDGLVIKLQQNVCVFEIIVAEHEIQAPNSVTIHHLMGKPG